MASDTYDPRHYITQTAFNVAPELIGTPLAPPWRRAVALLFDLTLAGMMSLAGFWGAVAIFASAYLGRLSRKRAARAGGSGSLALTTASGLVLCFGLVYGCATNDTPDEEDNDLAVAAMTDLDGVSQADQEQLQALMATQAQWMKFVPEDVRDELSKSLTTDDPDQPPSQEERLEDADLLHRFADAYAADDEAALDTLDAAAARIAAGSRLDALRKSNDALDDRIDGLEHEVEALTEELDNPSFMRSVRALAADFGLTLGWVGFYFSLFVYWTQGYTPGKRLLGIRIKRLNGQRINLWHAFERYGGYWAGVFTGLLGFAQVGWDANRQGIHDKIAGTVVVYAGRSHRLPPSTEAYSSAASSSAPLPETD